MIIILEKQRDIIGNFYPARIVDLLNISIQSKKLWDYVNSCSRWFKKFGINLRKA